MVELLLHHTVYRIVWLSIYFYFTLIILREVVNLVIVRFPSVHLSLRFAVLSHFSLHRHICGSPAWRFREIFGEEMHFKNTMREWSQVNELARVDLILATSKTWIVFCVTFVNNQPFPTCAAPKEIDLGVQLNRVDLN